MTTFKERDKQYLMLQTKIGFNKLMKLLLVKKRTQVIKDLNDLREDFKAYNELALEGELRTLNNLLETIETDLGHLGEPTLLFKDVSDITCMFGVDNYVSNSVREAYVVINFIENVKLEGELEGITNWVIRSVEEWEEDDETEHLPEFMTIVNMFAYQLFNGKEKEILSLEQELLKTSCVEPTVISCLKVTLTNPTT